MHIAHAYATAYAWYAYDAKPHIEDQLENFILYSQTFFLNRLQHLLTGASIITVLKHSRLLVNYTCNKQIKGHLRLR